MGYYVRVLGKNDLFIGITELQEALKKEGLEAALTPHGEVDNWTITDVFNSKGELLTRIEKNLVVSGELGAEELEEFREEIKDCKPSSAADWLDEYFNNIQVIYAFQLMDKAFEGDNFGIITMIRRKIWHTTGGILQADNEGFTNDDGYHILWQFSAGVTGDCHCAVLDEENEWEEFIMDLGNEQQRQEFQEGKVPTGAES